MKYLIIPALATLLITASCSSTKKTTDSNNTSTSQQSAAADGSSFDKAIVIKAKSEGPGVNAEYAWLNKNYPGYKSRGQRLVYHDKKPFDVISIETDDGKKQDVYFNISNFFGKL